MVGVCVCVSGGVGVCGCEGVGVWVACWWGVFFISRDSHLAGGENTLIVQQKVQNVLQACGKVRFRQGVLNERHCKEYSQHFTAFHSFIITKGPRPPLYKQSWSPGRLPAGFA